MSDATVPAPNDQENSELFRAAVAGWGPTTRLCLILVAENITAIVAVLAWLASRR